MAFIVSCEAEVPEDGVEPFASAMYGSTVTAGLEWPGVRQFVMGSESDVQERARMMAAAWLAVAAASEDRVAEAEARSERYRLARYDEARFGAADEAILRRDLARERAS